MKILPLKNDDFGATRWQLPDGRLVKHDGSFDIGNTTEEEEEEEEGDLTAQLIWHHDTLGKQGTLTPTTHHTFQGCLCNVVSCL